MDSLDLDHLFPLFFDVEKNINLGGYDLPLKKNQIKQNEYGDPVLEASYFLEFDQEFDQYHKLSRIFYFYSPPLIDEIEFRFYSKHLEEEDNQLFKYLWEKIEKFLTQNLGDPTEKDISNESEMSITWEMKNEDSEIRFDLIIYDRITLDEIQKSFKVIQTIE